ncbi:Retrovirus-related Pol polyprotein from transposon 412 [Merluccius polli]|uniref:Gypsy retrotransposon integrase-like protein 1 n=1 Tax=Merluccius polli TaxID=89951 RepID=A0AA47NAY3_MERPO|nr:Retrovirus-related Pol polyprotein from transposon 412 [Merluccius polli]
MAHTHLASGHIWAWTKPRERVVARFYWPGVRRDVERYCQECPSCQRVAPRGGERSPLIPMPIIETPFERIAIRHCGPPAQDYRVGLPKEILTDQGSCFMSRVIKELLKILQVAQLRTSVYHPQTDGLVERFNKTIKQMLKKCITEDGKNWDQLLPHVLFAIREVPQASTGSRLLNSFMGGGPVESWTWPKRRGRVIRPPTGPRLNMWSYSGTEWRKCGP